MPLIDTILGRPLASHESGKQRIGAAVGVPTFGLDALSSAAYGPEAALTVLLPAGAAGLAYIFPITVAIVILLGIVYLSYRQTIAAYPSGGGSYTVARENLGENAGLVAAAALMTDYVLNVAVGISAGVGALISALPLLQPYTLALCVAILILLAFVNLRGRQVVHAADLCLHFEPLRDCGVGRVCIYIVGRPSPADSSSGASS
jgi:amino acid transporter